VMSKIRAIIVDDELSARENLSYLIKNFCPDLTVVSTSSNVDEAVKCIVKLKPDVVFLDIEMPHKDGFQLLTEFKEINFIVIFITAYDQYALKAFEVSALDYILKPIDIERLIEVVDRIKDKQTINSYKLRTLSFLDNHKKITKISIPYKSDYKIVSIEDIIYIEADRMYSHIYTTDHKRYTAAKKLSYYEDLFIGSKDIQRVHRSWIVNLTHVKSYTKCCNGLYILDKLIPVSKTHKEKIEILLGK